MKVYGHTTGSYNRSKNLVGFLVGPVQYGVDIQRVQEIINPLPVVSLPDAPRGIVGVADYRGDVVPVLDLRQRFRLERQEPTRRTKWIVVRVDDRLVGWVVDAVTDVFGTASEDQRAVPNIGGHEAGMGISAVFAYASGLVFVLDVFRVAAVMEDLELPPAAALANSPGGTTNPPRLPKGSR